MRQTNDLGLQIIKRNEGLRLTSYQDTGGVWTIGFGHTPSHPGQSISLDQAEALLASDIAWAEDAVYGATHTVLTTANQFSAMVSLTFNIGANAFRRSTVLRRHTEGANMAAADAFLLWNQDNGEVLKGLVRRREEERELYLNPVEAMPRAVLPAVDLDIKGKVRALQHSLKAAGFYNGMIDGLFGPLSYAAIRSYQRLR